MAEMYAVGGKYANFLKRLTAVPSATVDTDYPVSRLVDELPASFCRFAAVGTDDLFTYDLDQLAGVGGFEAGLTFGTDYGAWHATGAGVWSQSATSPYAGTYNLKLVSGGAAGEQLYTRLPVRSGHYYTLTGALKGTGSGGTRGLILRVQDRLTGLWLKSDGTWDASPQVLHSNYTGSYTAMTPLRFLVTAAAATRWDHGSRDLRVVIETGTMTAADVCYADGITLTPDWDTAWLAGHNLGPQLTATLETSADNASWSTEATFTVRQPLFYYAKASPTAVRYVRFKFGGTSVVPNLVGELGIGKRLSVARLPKREPMVTYEEETEMPVRGVAVGNTDFPPRKMEFSIDWFTQAQYDEWRDLVFGECRGGRYPMLLVPDSTDPEMAMYGRINPALSFTKTKRNAIRESDRIVFEEAYLPTVVTT